MGPWAEGRKEGTGAVRDGIWNPKPPRPSGSTMFWELPLPIFWPLPGVPGPGLPPEDSEPQPPTPPPSSFAKKEPPLEPWQTLAGANRQERGRCVIAQRKTCVKVWGRGQARGRGLKQPQRTEGAETKPACCPGGGLSRSRLRRGVCSSWPGVRESPG